MKLTPTKASLFALALFVAPATMQAPAFATSDGSIVVAQAGQNSKRIDNIKKFLERGRNIAKLSEDQLQQRLDRVRGFQNTPNLPSDLMASLQQAEQELSNELSRRQQAGTGGSTGADQTDAGQDNGTKNQRNQQQQSAGAGAGSGDIDAFLASVTPASELDDKALRQQMRKAAELSKSSGVSKDQRKQLREIVRSSRDEMAKRKQGGGGSNTNASKDGQQKGAGQSPAAGSGDIDGFLASVTPASELDDKALRQQMRKAAELSKSSGVSKDQRKQLREIVRASRDEMAKRKDGGGKQSKDNGTQQDMAGKADSGGNGNTAMDDNADPEKLSDAELRKRLSSMRDRLSSNDLTPAEKKALRQRLASERAILRNRVGQKNDTKVNGDNNTVTNINTTINRDTVKVVINDKRPGRDLSDAELRHRINVIEFAIRDNSYSESDRVAWRAFLDRDRKTLRERMLTMRERRRDNLRMRVGNGDLKFKLSLNFQPDRPPPPRYVFAAEADEADLEDVLTAPPRRKISRRYTVEEVENSPDLRDAVARIEIDTVKFGFGESFVPEEEVDSLDRIAEIMEKVLAANPGEVFMIEGHTDAVGSDSANLELSRERAKAVKEALVTYYVIPPENLKTVGFGEKYLKIPTEDAEAENRRVSVARITPLVGELDN